MAINYNPKVGAILVCNFGDYVRRPDGTTVSNEFNSRLSPEMVKNRLVMVINAKIDSNACIVVPLSTTLDSTKLKKGLHVELTADLIPEIHYFSQQIRWAKADLVQQVSKFRLFKLRAKERGHIEHVVAPEIVAAVQRAIIKGYSEKVVD
ncbi:type II toxin-antitoxin system PemK/MazF family toxin [Pseudomonas mosselii]|uniref:Type II toxin-antitoxin system PemK/MazF family toxin n=1 Tax=Pseudomonas mosselii TaxID=78327 RepID=A0A7W2JV38_9PSED|nr:type II toxin-antitoxin system PemK/MazF family toxin [Pseudomonas mosselii]MBA6065723.1 type II toxin-antitoxin system PemK/MazF family toxin [Pseudomonas mosselii]